MKFLNGNRLTIATLALTFATSLLASSPADAKQTSLDSRIFQAFEKIDERTNAHERDVVRIRGRLDKLSKRIERMRDDLSNLSSDDNSREQRQRRQALSSQLINLTAKYLNQAYKRVDAASEVIAANLNDLTKLTKEIRNSDDPSGGVKKLQSRVQRNVAMGRAMRGALLEMRSWAKLDPGLSGRFKSLRRIALALDRRITVDKTRVSTNPVSSTGVVKSRRLQVLDQTIDRLGDMYAQAAAEKETLKDLRDEVNVSIQLGRLDMTKEVAERALPNLTLPNEPGGGIKPIQTITQVIQDLNVSLARRTDIPAVSQAKGAQSPNDLEIADFSNF